MLLENCLFCKIIERKLNADIVSESKESLAFKDINPQAPVHILIIPKIHIETTSYLNESNISVFTDMLLLSNKIARDDNFLELGYRWVVNNGHAGGQTVNHIHLHLLAGRKMKWPPG